MNFADVIDLWPSPRKLADAIGAEYKTVAKWRHRNTIPSDYWLAVVSACRQAGHHQVTLGVLAEAADQRRRERTCA